MFSTTATTILFGLAALGFTSAAPTSNTQLEARASYEGTATYYYQGGNPGSCGDWHAGESSKGERCLVVRIKEADV